jgi:hypothetical protein
MSGEFAEIRGEIQIGFAAPEHADQSTRAGLKPRQFLDLPVTRRRRRAASIARLARHLRRASIGF